MIGGVELPGLVMGRFTSPQTPVLYVVARHTAGIQMFSGSPNPLPSLAQKARMSCVVHPNGQVTDPQLPLGVAGIVTDPGPHPIA